MTVTRLIAPDAATLQAIRDLPKDVTAHDAMMAATPALTRIEAGGSPDCQGPLALPLTIAAWNLERCLFPAPSAEKLRGADIVLLSEMDDGMARSAQAHPTAEIAKALGMGYLYGVEFVELGLGSESERAFCTDLVNARGLHGNAALARGAFSRPFLLRLPGARYWFFNDPEQPRLGERMAIGGVVATEIGDLVVTSTHFESVADAALRQAQMAAILDLLDREFPELPFVIGGDLNSGNHLGGDWRAETFFDLARERGCEIHGGDETVATTRPSLITRWPERAMKLDWFVTKGLRVADVEIVPSLDPSGRPLSDHDLLRLRVLGRAD